MKRLRITLERIAGWDNLLCALHKAARGKRYRGDVAVFLNNADAGLQRMADDIVNERLPYGGFHAFQIRDPKPRLIHAAAFPDRVFHHALINLAGPRLERAMMPTSFACRPDMGVHRAARQVQYNLRRFPWYGQIDIDGYFASIPHGVLLSVLMRYFKGEAFEAQLRRILNGYHHTFEHGLPIGSLTSQYFANIYLNGLDRRLAADGRVCAHVRYMDDIMWWCREKRDVPSVLHDVKAYLHQARGLRVKANEKIQRSAQGAAYCGYRLLPGTVRLSRRRQRRYAQRRRYWEQLWLDGVIDDSRLQCAYAAVNAMTCGADADGWRRKNLSRWPSPDV